MSGKVDQLKGRAKQAAGVLTGDKSLEREGKLDRAIGKAKEKTGELADDLEKKAKAVVKAVDAKLGS